MLWGTFTTLFQIWIDLRDCAIQLNFNALLLFFLMLPQFNTNLLKFEKKIAALMGYSSWEPRTSVWKVLMRLFWNPAAWLLLQNPLSKENCASFANLRSVCLWSALPCTLWFSTAVEHLQPQSDLCLFLSLASWWSGSFGYLSLRPWNFFGNCFKSNSW